MPHLFRHFVVVLVEAYDGLDTTAEHVEGEIFVGRVDGIAFQTEAHQDGLDAEYALEVADDGDRTTTAHCQWALAKGLGKSCLGSTICWQVDGAYITLTTVHWAYFYAYAPWSNGFDIINEEPRNLLMLLVGNKACRNFSVSL